MLQVGKPAPHFKGQALVGREFKDINLDALKGKWVVLFFYPMDFTFVCPTELVAFNNAVADFEDRNAVVISASTDTVFSHLGWVKADERLANLKYPILGDVTKKISQDYGVLTDEGIALRGTFIIDNAGILRWAAQYDLNVGRNIEETLRVLDALQTDELCPCNWEKGQDTLKAG